MLEQITNSLAEHSLLLQLALPLVALALVVVVAVLGSGQRRETRRASALLEQLRDEVQAKTGQIREFIGEAVGRRNAALEDAVAHSLDAGVLQLKQQQQKVGEIAETARAAIAEMSAAFAESDRQSRAAIAEMKTAVEQHGVYVHDQAAALSAAQERALAAAAEELRKRADARLANVEKQNAEALAALAQTRQNLESAFDGMHRDMNTRCDSIESRVQDALDNKLAAALRSFEGLDDKIASLAEAQAEIDRAGKEIGRLSRLLVLAADAADGEGDGEARLAAILARALDDSAYALGETIGGEKAAAVLRFPPPHGDLAIDAGLDVSAFVRSVSENGGREEREAARAEFHNAAEARIHFAAKHFIAPPQTAQSVILFVPMEAAFAEMHSRHRDLLSLAANLKVWVVSPATIAAVLVPVSAAARDYRAHQRLQLAREAAENLMREAADMEKRLGEMNDHVQSAWRSAQRAEQAGQKMLGGVRAVSETTADDKNGGESR